MQVFLISYFLISFCTHTGFWLMEKRLVDVVIRYGAAFLNEYTPDKWRAYLWLKTHSITNY